MTSINLLPWREALKKERQQRFIASLIGSAVIVVVLLFLVHLQYNLLIEKQNARNNFLQEQIEKVEKQIKEIEQLEAEKQRLLARMNVIQNLQQNRPQIVHVFDQMVRTLPDGVHLTSLQQSGMTISLNGLAQSNARVSAYMRNIDQSDWFNNPKLNIIEAAAKASSKDAGASATGQRSSRFTLNFGIVDPNVPVEETTTVANAAPATKGKGGKK